MNAEFNTIAKRLKVFFCDSDGVMFPNTTWMGAPFKAKYRSYYDGQGISLMRAVGILVVFITNEQGASAAAIRETVEKLNALPSSKSEASPHGWEHVVLFEGRGGIKKLETAADFLRQHDLSFDEAAFMGDDLVDVPLLKAVALPASPASAEEAIRKLSLFVAARDGGAGAIRDFANALLAARGVDPLTLPPQ